MFFDDIHAPARESAFYAHAVIRSHLSTLSSEFSWQTSLSFSFRGIELIPRTFFATRRVRAIVYHGILLIFLCHSFLSSFGVIHLSRRKGCCSVFRFAAATLKMDFVNPFSFFELLLHQHFLFLALKVQEIRHGLICYVFSGGGGGIRILKKKVRPAMIYGFVIL